MDASSKPGSLMVRRAAFVHGAETVLVVATTSAVGLGAGRGVAEPKPPPPEAAVGPARRPSSLHCGQRGGATAHASYLFPRLPVLPADGRRTLTGGAVWAGRSTPLRDSPLEGSQRRIPDLSEEERGLEGSELDSSLLGENR